MCSATGNAEGRCFVHSFALNFYDAVGLQRTGHSVRWASVMSGGFKARNTEWTLMSVLTKVCERLLVNYGFEFPPISMNEVPPSFS